MQVDVDAVSLRHGLSAPIWWFAHMPVTGAGGNDKGSPWSPSERATAFSKQLLRWSQWKFLSEKP
jgi:hypothetical protein